MKKHICVFSSSSDDIDLRYMAAAEELGKTMAERGDALVYGGGNIGLMGVMSKAIHRYEGTVIGVIPRKLKDRGLAYHQADELIVVDTLRERKAVMETKADAFIALPGGFGTLEEILEIITLKQLHYHQKPIVLLNVNNFYDQLIGFFQHMYDQQFAREDQCNLYYVTPRVRDALAYIDCYGS
jgi:cytokinin riboside 5'-monophosphate phosphoribohydrolase